MMFYEDINLLTRLTLPGTVSGALTFLERIEWIARMQLIKEHFFPQDQTNFDDWADLDSQFVTFWELRLFKLMNENLFPLPESLLTGEEMFILIPAWPYYPNWYDSDFEDLPKCFQLVVHLLYEGYGSTFDDCKWLENISVDVPESAQIDTEILNNLCVEFGTPLIVLPTVLEILDGESGNIWLDANSEAYLEFEWTIENIEALKEHWDGATAIASQINDLSTWLDEPKNLNIFLEIWRNSYEVDTPKEPSALIEALRDLYDDSPEPNIA